MTSPECSHKLRCVTICGRMEIVMSRDRFILKITIHGRLNLFPGQPGHAWEQALSFIPLHSLEGHVSNSSEQWHKWEAAVLYVGHVLIPLLRGHDWQEVPKSCPRCIVRPVSFRQACQNFTSCPMLCNDCANVDATGGLTLLSGAWNLPPNSWTSPRIEKDTSPQSRSSYHSCDSCRNYCGENQFSTEKVPQQMWETLSLSTVHHQKQGET